MTKELDLKLIHEKFREFLISLKTVHLATLDANNLPEASYAPYVKLDSAYYLFISDLAKHTINLKLNSSISLMFIEDEGKCRNHFSRRRAILQGKATIVKRSTSKYLSVIREFKSNFGEFIDIIEPLQDFNLFQITPDKGRYIEGFGQAFELTGDDMNNLKHIVPKPT